MKKEFTAAIIVIGDEILSGRTQDTNSNWIAQKLTEHGISLKEIRVVDDNQQSIISAVNALRKSYDYVFTTGGIGPTHDDITADSIAWAFDVPIAENEAARNKLLQHYGEAELSDARLRMARIPSGATLIDNPVSAAPGFQIENVYVMAGVPKIMQAMLDCVLPSLSSGAVVLSKTVSCQIQESVVAPILEDIQNMYEGVKIGSYPSYGNGTPRLNIVLRGIDEEKLSIATHQLLKALDRFGVV